MKDTVLKEIHEELGAKMVPFAGFNMPIEYSGIKEEHMCVRNDVGIFDVSHMGEFWIKGEHAADLLQQVTCNDVRTLEPGKAQYTCLTNEEGGIVDDLLIYQYEGNKYMLVVNAANIEKDWNWIKKYNYSNVEMEDASDEMALIALQGPRCKEILGDLTEIEVKNIKNFHFVVGTVAGINNVIISKTGYTGEAGFEFFCYNKDAKALWEELMKAGAKANIKPIGLGARDTLRLEAGLCLYGNDIDDTTSPIEANLEWITKLDTDFIGKEQIIARNKERKQRRLIGFKMSERGIPRKGYKILDKSKNEAGFVTSGTISPIFNEGIGMGYIDEDLIQTGSTIYVQIRSKEVLAQIVNLHTLRSRK